MSLLLSKYWWIYMFRGILSIIFGIMALSWPGVTYASLVIFFGAFILVDGVFASVAAFRNIKESKDWWVVLLEGICGIIFGFLTFLWPGITALLLLGFISTWAVIIGILELGAAVKMRKDVKGEWLFGFSGILSVLFGILLVLHPRSGIIAVTWLIGFYALYFGILLTGLSIRIHNLRTRIV